MVGAIYMYFCNIIRWANNANIGRYIWHAKIFQWATYFYILQPTWKNNRKYLPKEFWTRLMVMDFCNNKKERHMSNCRRYREIRVASLAWTFHITATEQTNISVGPQAALNVSTTLDDTALYLENQLLFLICYFTKENILKISKMYTCSDISEPQIHTCDTII